MSTWVIGEKGMTERKIELLKTVIMLSIYEIVMALTICAVFHGPLKAYLFFVGIAVIHSVINIILVRYR